MKDLRLLKPPADLTTFEGRKWLESVSEAKLHLVSTDYTPTVGGSGAMTVAATSIPYAFYFNLDKLVWISLAFSTTTGGVANAYLTASLPTTLTPAETTYVVVYTVDGGTAEEASPGWISSAGVVRFYRPALANWTLGAGRQGMINAFYRIA